MPKGITPPPAHIDGKARAAIYRKQGDQPWKRLTGGLPEPINYMAYGLVTDPEASGHVYAGMSNGEVWQSQDFGDNWQCLPFNLTAVHRAMVLLRP